MITIGIGTRTAIGECLVGASNLDLGTYLDGDGATRTGPTITLSIPDTGQHIVGAGSVVRIGLADYLVADIVMGDTPAECTVHLVPAA